MKNTLITDCPLCGSANTVLLAETGGKYYYECGHCWLAFLDPAHHPDPDDEKAHYLTHKNNPRDKGYRDFLDRLVIPMTAQLAAGSRGLDYGSGPGPTLSVMMKERGFEMQTYDPFFAKDIKVLAGTYDFITCTETVEHFHHPGREFQQCERMLRPAGWLGIMTGMRLPETEFAEWYYVRDPTHVCFYQMRTMEWIAQHYGWTLYAPAPNVVLYQTGS